MALKLDWVAEVRKKEKTYIGRWMKEMRIWEVEEKSNENFTKVAREFGVTTYSKVNFFQIQIILNIFAKAQIFLIKQH